MSKHRWRNAAFLGCFVLSILLIFLLISAPAPHLSFEYRGETIEISADRAWVWQPGGCLQVSWILDDTRTIHIEGIERTESGAEQFCPAINRSSPRIELTDYIRDVYRSYELNTYYLPDFLLNLAGVVGLALFGVIALYYLWTNDPQKRPSFSVISLAFIALILCIALLRLSGLELTIVGVLATLRNLFTKPIWQYLGAILAACLYLALGLHSLRLGWKYRRFTDFVVLGGFLVFVLLLYAPFGFATIGHWEEWHSRVFLEGTSWRHWDNEFTSRFWILVPHALAYAISSETFHGFNLVYALILWGRMVLLYGILRQLSVRSLFAFLITMLFAVYPVDSGLMSLRSLPLQFSFLSLLTAVYLILHHFNDPKRLYQVGVWVSLLMCVGAYESGYTLIFFTPFLWWYLRRKRGWMNLRLTASWYLIPAFKVMLLSLILFAGRGFYRSNSINVGQDLPSSSFVRATFEDVVEVYWQTFAVGWHNAVDALGSNSRLPLALAMLALTAAIAFLLGKGKDGDWAPSRKQYYSSLLIGLLLILPSIGVLIWIDEYSRDLWRLYTFVPIPAALVAFSLVGLLTTRIAKDRQRNATIVVLCLLLMLPAVSRLVAQHEHFVASANRKSRILTDMVTLAPRYDPSSQVVLFSKMTRESLQDLQVRELSTGMLHNAIYLLYEGNGPRSVHFCNNAGGCFPSFDGFLQLRLDEETDYSKIVFFLLHEDLTVELLRDFPTELIGIVTDKYDVDRLIDSSAPLPPRAFTMLGLATQ